MIDNYDSFTFNLVHYFRALGQEVEVYRNDQITIDEIAALAPEFIVISPGPCTPNEAGISLAAVEYFAGKIPLLGVCLGHQCIAQHFGASVEKAHKVMHGKTSPVYHKNTNLFAQLNNPLTVTRYHSLVVVPSTMPNCLEVTAWTKNEQQEQDIVMAIKHRNMPICGVQFHPESILTEQGSELLANFIQEYGE